MSNTEYEDELVAEAMYRGAIAVAERLEAQALEAYVKGDADNEVIAMVLDGMAAPLAYQIAKELDPETFDFEYSEYTWKEKGA